MPLLQQRAVIAGGILTAPLGVVEHPRAGRCRWIAMVSAAIANF
jgi:hypothetical protein